MFCIIGSELLLVAIGARCDETRFVIAFPANWKQLQCLNVTSFINVLHSSSLR